MNKERHLKSRKQETWTTLRIELDKVAAKHNLQSDFSLLDIQSWPMVNKNIWDKFINSSASGQLSDRLKLQVESFQDAKGIHHLDKLIDPEEEVWFFVNETVREQDKYWFYQGKLKAVQIVIMESVGIDEFYIVSKKYDWLLCMNHHDIIIGAGEYIEEQLKKFKLKLGG